MPHRHTADCLITKDEAAELAACSRRTIDNWTRAGLLTKHTQGPTHYYVRYCRHEVRAALQVRAG